MTSSSAKAPSRLIAGDSEPKFIYGTAWKKDQTKRLVKEALVAGFRHIDTANQPRHYTEPLVGEGLREWLSEGRSRTDVYVCFACVGSIDRAKRKSQIQTKYTSPAGQDLTNMPYNPQDPVEVQVNTSVASSLKNLRPRENWEDESYLDCVLLHSPLPTVEQTLQAWTTLESYVPAKIRSLGISNVTLPILKAIYESSTIKPSVVQNRFYPQTQYDGPLRTFCREHGISYQSFWTLTGNPNLLKSDAVISLAKSAGVNSAIALYALVMDLDIVVLNGTTSETHMREDIEGIKNVRQWALANEQEWEVIRSAFARLLEVPARFSHLQG
jgi:diketogulonate reductase-like aldo/keto reductase